MATIKISIGEIHVEKEDMLIVKFIDKSDIDQSQVHEGVEAVQKITKGKLYYSIMDARNTTIGHITTGAFNMYAQNKLTKNKIAEAIVLNSPGIRLLANFYIKTFKPMVPTKIFTSLEDAKNWLRDIKQKKLILNTNLYI